MADKQYHIERREYCHDETHNTLINDESMYLEMIRIISHPVWPIRYKAKLLRQTFGDLRDYKGAVIGKYANFTQIAREEMAALTPISFEDWKAKYGPKNFSNKS